MSNAPQSLLHFIDRALAHAQHGDLERDAADRGHRVRRAGMVAGGIIVFGLLLIAWTGEWSAGVAFSFIMGGVILAVRWPWRRPVLNGM